jgi:hypothetical protein
MSVAAFSIPAPATQPGTTNLLDTLNGQLLNAVARSDPGASGKEAVWTQHAIDGPGGRSVVRWYEVIPADLNVRQQGTISDPSSFVFNGAISPAGNGQDAVIEYSASGPSLKPSIRASAHRAAGTLGSTGFPITIVTSAFSFDDFTCIGQFQPCRWGDYSGASPDPLNSDVVWGTNQYSGGQVSGGDAWATRNFAVQVQPGGPTAAVSASPGTVNTGQTVNFDGSTSADTEAQIVDYRWDLDGNGTFETDTGSTRTVSRSYATAGTVNPRLRVTDANGDHNDSATTVTVNAPPPPPPPQPSAACLAARAKRDQLAKTVKALKKRLAKAKKASAKRRYRKTLARRKAQLKQAQKAATQLCP